MNTANREDQILKGRQITPIVFPVLLAVILLTILFRLPQPTIPVNLPYKVELLLAAFLAVMLGYLQFSGVSHRMLFSRINGNLRLISTAIGGFIIWSGISALWAPSAGAVAHHTLLWAVYLVFFLLFTGIILLESGIRTIVSTFALAALILGVLCVFDYISVGDFASNEGPLRIRYGKYAEMLVTLLQVLWVAAVYSRSSVGMLVLAGTGIIGWMTVMLSLSKGAFIAGVVGFALFFVGGSLFSSTVLRKRMLVFAALWLAVTLVTQIAFSAFSAFPSTTDYITGKADPSRTTTEMRLFTWTVGRQMARDHWLAGVGADNFGNAFNQSRARMRERQPDVPKQEIAEDYLTERAHNEPLQILAELGAVGFTLFALPFALFAYLLVRKFWRDDFRLSPILWASTAGMAAFAVSSMVSSFSFRSAQNGVVFFLVLAIAVNELRKPLGQTPHETSHSLPVFAFSWLSALLLAAFCLTKGFAEYQVYTGERTESPAAAQARFHAAMTADPGYSGAYLSSAARYVAEGDQANAAAMTRKAIETGIALSLTYSQLARQQIAAGGNAAAEATFREALTIYPRSIFVRVEYVVFLEKQGRSDEAERQLTTARSMDQSQANGWYSLITLGSISAFYRAQTNPDIAMPADLLPAGAVFQYIDKNPN